MIKSKILSVLDGLGVKYEGEFNYKGWLPILCPFHSDSNFGNAFINDDSVIKCFSCGQVSNLFKVVKLKRPKLTNREIFEYLGENSSSKLDRILNSREDKSQKSNLQKSKRKVVNLPSKEVDLNLYYCKSREFTKDWIDHFQVTIISEGYYKDYFNIPIIFNGLKVSNEFRKSKEYEYFFKFMAKRGFTLEAYRSEYKKETKELKEKDIFLKYPKMTEEIYSYIKKPKTLYPLGSSIIKQNLFNIDSLDYNQDLYLCEGIAGTSEIWNKESKNVSALFGVNFSENQLKILNKFTKRIYVVSDEDEASDLMLYRLSARLPNVYVYQTKESGMDYLLKKSALMEFSIK
jgi:DNA primase